MAEPRRPLHNMSRGRFLRQLCALPLALAAAAAPALAAQWPERPIRLVVPYPAGGLTDAVSRIVGDELGRQLGTTVVVDNKAGAGGLIGLQGVLAAPRDGHTIALVVPATMITLPLTNPAFKIQPLQDFVPITAAVNTAATLIVSKELGVKTLEEFAAYGRKHPGAMSYGVPGGAGTSFHFNSVIMAGKLGIEAAYVPYPGEVQAFNDVAGGRLQYALVSSTMRPQIESGKVVPLAVAGRKRDAHMKQVPTFQEKGIDFTSDGWVGYAVASGTPPPVVARLSEAFVKALRTPAVRERLAGLGLDVVGSTPAEFQAAIRASTERYGALLRTGAVKIEN